jgi:Uncharacterized conserved protein
MSADRWKDLLDVISRFPEGASLEEILLALTPSISRRTMQRHLASLVKEGRLIVVGMTRARLYKLSENSGEASRKLDDLIPLTLESEKIRLHLIQPVSFRLSVSYQREFLECYRPNVDSYLSLEIKKKLLHLGGAYDGSYSAGTYARQIFHRLLIDLSWNSSRLEGNTYSLLETERLLEKGQAAAGKDLRETQMILNHKMAIEFLIHSAQEIGVNRYTVLNLHTLLSDNLLPDPAASGRLRSIPVAIAKSVYLPSSIPQVIEECFQLILDKARQIEDPFEQAFFLMVQLPYLQPFDDVNKRTSRLAANIPLIQKNLCPLSFSGVPEETYIHGLLGIYELNKIDLMRDVFVWAYEKSCLLYSTARKILGEPDPFRFHYRDVLFQIMGEIVRHRLDKMGAIEFIRKWVLGKIEEPDQARFIELVERELLGLHEGNIARYRLRPSEYEEWRKVWVKESS